MKYHRLYVDDTGESHWSDIEISLRERSFAPPAKSILLSEAEAAATLVFLKLEAGWDEPIHPTPRPQMLICLSGAARVTASDGEIRMIQQGDLWRMEDTSGKGHHTKVVSAQAFTAAVVQFD